MADLPPPNALVFANPELLLSAMPRNKMIIMGEDNKPAITLDFDAKPPTVTIRPGMEMAEVAKLFWNKTAQLVGQPVPFPDTH